MRALRAVVLLSFVAWCSGNAFYTAAVVEHSPVYILGNVTRGEAIDVMSQNLDMYEETIAAAYTQAEGGDLDIILFPEDGLYGASHPTRDSVLPYLEPLPKVGGTARTVNPCNEFSAAEQFLSPVIYRVSCMAQKWNLTIVFDMGELQPCAEGRISMGQRCPEDGRFQFNTLVAIDADGTLMATYRKSHLYYEPQFNEPLVPEAAYIDTRFGVRFGLMICFDVMFYQPQAALYDELNVRDFLWSSWWVNEPPVIMGTQMERARSQTLFRGTFLASGIGLSWRSSGSGIFVNGSTVREFYNAGSTPAEKVMVARVPKQTQSSSSSARTSKRAPHRVLDGAWSRRMESNRGGLNEQRNFTMFEARSGMSGAVEISSREVHCRAQFEVAAQATGSPEWYALMALSGKYNGLFSAEVCCLMKCVTEQSGEPSCSYDPVLSAETTFSSWSVSATISNRSRLIYPMVATDGSQLPPDYTYEVSRDWKSIRSSSTWLGEAGTLLGATIFGIVDAE